ncbi:DUF87 domain-containing protein [Glycocaulis profundi]|nr:DUF87 domain-containing protein [Glycocaulis profundi]
MTQPHDRRIHADALRRQHIGSQFSRFRRHAAVMFAATALGAMAVPWAKLDKDERWSVSVYAYAQATVWLATGIAANPAINVTYNGTAHRLSARDVVADPYYRGAASYALSESRKGGLLGFIAWLSGLLVFRGVVTRGRERALQDIVIAGTRVASEKKLARLTRGDTDSRGLAIGKVPIPARLETRHMAMIGTTGSGKTTALRQLLDGIEARGEAALVYDTSGEFIANYYQPERGDIILNPFDDRSANWSPFAEIAHPADAARIAQQLVTETGRHDSDVWVETARILVANMIVALWQEGNGTLPNLLAAFQNKTKDELKEWLKGTSSARTFADDADRATGSVLFMLAKAANLIQFLRPDTSGNDPFAFRRFIHGLDKHHGPKPWIFVPRKEDYFEASKPLLACWLECAASAVLGLPPSPDRRIWFVLDELADLPRVDNLARLLPEGRKFGAAVVLTFQALGQMQHRYGPQIAEAMLACCNTKLFLQTIDSETRQWASRTIGECEVETPTMTDALAGMDDGARTTLSKMRKMRPAVLESELRLAAFEGYLLFPDGLPVSKIKLTADHIARRGPARHPGFIAGDPDSTLWKKGGSVAPQSSPPSTTQGPV